MQLLELVSKANVKKMRRLEAFLKKHQVENLSIQLSSKTVVRMNIWQTFENFQQCNSYCKSLGLVALDELMQPVQDLYGTPEKGIIPSTRGKTLFFPKKWPQYSMHLKKLLQF